jgi:SAM-dependent methyltransferase
VVELGRVDALRCNGAGPSNSGIRTTGRRKADLGRLSGRKPAPIARPGIVDRRPYRTFAKIYDETTGFAAYPIIRDAIEDSLASLGVHVDVAADVGCGTGLLLQQMARIARRVYGVDRSREMLAIARRRVAGLPVTLLHQDLRRLTLPEAVDLITCTFDTLNYLLTERELLGALHQFHHNLARGGYLFFDVVTGAAWRAETSTMVRPIYWPDLGILFRIGVNPTRRLSVVYVDCLRCTRDGIGKIESEVHVQRWYPLGVLYNLLARAGLKVTSVRDLDTSNPATTTSNWVHVVSQRGLSDNEGVLSQR